MIQGGQGGATMCATRVASGVAGLPAHTSISHHGPRPTAHGDACQAATESSATTELSNELSNESTEQQED